MHQKINIKSMIKILIGLYIVNDCSIKFFTNEYFFKSTFITFIYSMGSFQANTAVQVFLWFKGSNYFVLIRVYRVTLKVFRVTLTVNRVTHTQGRIPDFGQRGTKKNVAPPGRFLPPLEFFGPNHCKNLTSWLT